MRTLDELVTAGELLVVERASADAAEALRVSSIRCILLKGPLQQDWLAAAGPRRPSIDVDLLVDPENAEAAGRVFERVGFRCEPEVTPGVAHHADLWTAPGQIPIEVHRNLWGTDPLAIWTTLAAETETVGLYGARVEIPNEAARCLIVALHAAHHGPGKDSALDDLHRALEVAPREAWIRAAALAASAGAEAAFAAGLGLAPAGVELREHLGLEAPPLTGRLALNLAEPVSGTAGFFWLGEQRGFRARARFAARKVFPPADFMRFKYAGARQGRVGLALAYAYRPLWIAARLIPGFVAWRRARGATRR